MKQFFCHLRFSIFYNHSTTFKNTTITTNFPHIMVWFLLWHAIVVNSNHLFVILSFMFQQHTQIFFHFSIVFIIRALHCLFIYFCTYLFFICLFVFFFVCKCKWVVWTRTMDTHTNIFLELHKTKKKSYRLKMKRSTTGYFCKTQLPTTK